jgi:hypothetical protein
LIQRKEAPRERGSAWHARSRGGLAELDRLIRWCAATIALANN